MLFAPLSPFLTLPFSSFTPWRDGNPSTVQPTDTGSFDWDDKLAGEHLSYADCYDDFHCARLQVPLDWTASPQDDNRTVELAVIKLPATVPVTDQRYGGPVLINPGGPGGSGVAFSLIYAKAIQTILSASSGTDGKHFDIISFDPRGVGYTRPFFTCFADDSQETLNRLLNDMFSVLDSSDAAFDNYWASMRATADGCSKRQADSGIARYITTASVARDAVELFERHGEWREKQGRELLSVRGPQGQEPLSASDSLDRIRYRPGLEKIQYWGFSYGTLLGSTLAAQYPDRISRVVLDAVVDGFDYTKGDWLANLQDIDTIIDKFGEHCWRAGPERCPVYDPESPEAIVRWLYQVLDDLKRSPIGVLSSEDGPAELATYTDLKRLIFLALYKPLNMFPKVARVIRELSQGNGTGLVQSRLTIRKSLETCLSPQCAQDGLYSPSCFRDLSNRYMASEAIRCSDAAPQLNDTKEHFWDYVEEVTDQSPVMGPLWGSLRIACTQWHARPVWRYEGNFTAKTAHPILFIGNTADPVTPLRNAFTMSAGFDDSVVLQQDSEGHGSISSVSFCTSQALRRYFQTGELPAKGTVCQTSRSPFDGYDDEDQPAMPHVENEEDLWKAMVSLTR